MGRKVKGDRRGQEPATVTHLGAEKRTDESGNSGIWGRGGNEAQKTVMIGKRRSHWTGTGQGQRGAGQEFQGKEGYTGDKKG